MEKTDKKPLHPWSQAHYRIEVQGSMADSWADIFPGMQITTRGKTHQTIITALSGPVIDQSELVGVLNNLVEMHLPILLVKQIS